VRGQLFQDRSHIRQNRRRLQGAARAPPSARSSATGPTASRHAPGDRAGADPGAGRGRSYANGGSAFTFVGTIDLRVQKAFTVGRAEIAAVVDVVQSSNLEQRSHRIVVSGSQFRTPTALQPPRTLVAGVRLAF